MATTTLQNISGIYIARSAQVSPLRKFLLWTNSQQKNRLLWLGVILSAHGCILTPLTAMAILLAGTNLTLLILATVAMGMALVTNLAALPTKITLPVFFLSILIDIVIVVIAATTGFDISSTYI
ncbi:MAG: hypothetical protein ACJ75B_02860 [Flavisolibacter sp.]